MSVVIFSGGMDSTVLLTAETRNAKPVVALSFEYGQRHRRELVHARQIAHELDVEHHVVGLGDLAVLLRKGALTDHSTEVPEGHYAEDSMKATIVPNRNAIMLSMAAGYAVAHGHETVAFGAHAGDHYVYPDCRPAFIQAINSALIWANDGVATIGVVAPFQAMTKTDIAKLGDELGAPLHLSWSCYKGGELHCGVCGTCTERREAFADAGLEDPTTYEQRAA